MSRRKIEWLQFTFSFAIIILVKGYGAKIWRLTTYVKAENRMVTNSNVAYSAHTNNHLV